MKIGIFSNSINFINKVLEQHEKKVIFVVFDSDKIGENPPFFKAKKTIFLKYSQYSLNFSFSLDIDILLCYDFTILPKKIIDTPRLCSINIHPASLPDFAGKYPWPMLVESRLKSSCVSAHFMLVKPDSGRVIKTRKYFLYTDDYYSDWKVRTEVEAINLASSLLSDSFIPIKLRLCKNLKSKDLINNPISRIARREVRKLDFNHIYDVIRINSEISGTDFYYNSGKKITIFKVKNIKLNSSEIKINSEKLSIYNSFHQKKLYILIGSNHLEIQKYNGEIPKHLAQLKLN